ncbi:uncharacterized protein K452DRAFT_300277 [Aplosporella prunicola CBS 121167]|uniref:Major facilitator superfamily (MFS) profile domain-containing protein n=1 Tax=Aplosporella prunicola CBS 121167 TaxID=1176127 RepID=A0A6A6B8T4_9PEZI|nr:uncharacterized protein K452DRAFT_300277 [Aplosporella prunicola CBS 121167]KAF2139773.1 hypothetical protein K452DRAFT_300277 [Aplosporella prunicola CBS 121167]
MQQQQQQQQRDPNEKHSAAPDEPSFLVTWDGPDDPLNPKNWPAWRKWAAAILTSLGGLVTLMSGAMMAPALGDISASLHIGEEEANLALSIFILAFAFGPLVLAPCSEVFGRKRVWLASSLWYTLWNLICGFANTKGVMIAGRFFAGLGASSQFAISLPVLSDCWKSEERGKSFALATFIPLLGPALGPILGGIIAEAVGWRWLFWVLSAFDALLMFLTLFLFRETHAPTILARKANTLTKHTGHPHYTDFEADQVSLLHRLKVGLTRPYRLLVTQPILQLMSLFLAYNFGILYIVLATFATMWIDVYHEAVNISGINYLGLVIGYTIAAQVGGPATDRIWKHLQAKHGGNTAPEYRVPLMLPSIVLIPTGLFWYGWSVHAHLHWAMTDVGIGIFGCGIILGTQSMQAYVMDAFPHHTASASAASQFLRNVFAFAFPIFAPKMYKNLGYGWGNSLLAFLFLAFGVPAPLVLWKYGAKLRALGKPQQ